MAQYTPRKIISLINDIEKGKINLPAMQRNFVWEEEKIQKLFDSLMHDYPIGTFLFWNIDNQTFKEYTFKKFIKNYDEQNRDYQRGELADEELSEYFAVLDGQQRITALYLGIKGSWRTHKKYTDWTKDTSYFFRYFCINILQQRDNDDMMYDFKFINEADIGKPINIDGKNCFWVKVSDIIEDRSDEHMDIITENFPVYFPNKIGNSARKILRKLNSAICIAENIHYYSAENMSLSEVAEIFVRVNNGGQKLSYSDLMLSIATGYMNGEDIHEKIEEKINYINSKADENTGFKVDSELILTAGLMFTNARTLSLRNPENYKLSRMKIIFDEQWEAITEALAVAVEYIEYLGFQGSKLTSKNIILPISYYFYANNISISKEKGGNARAICDFIFIRQWILRVMITSIFRAGISSTLLKIRSHISTSNKYFPLDDMMIDKKTLIITDDHIEDIFEYKKGDSRVIPLLMELAHINTSKLYDADHIWPQNSIATNKAIRKNYPNVSEKEINQFKYNCDRIANIEILDPGINKSKSDTSYAEWLANNPQQTSYFESCCIPQNISYDYKDFLDFIQERKKILAKKIKQAFPNDFYEIVSRYSLQKKMK